VSNCGAARCVRRNPSRLIFTEQLGCRPSAWLFLEINVGKLLAVVTNDDGCANILD